MPTEHFKDAESYRRFNAFRHIHGIKAPHLKTVIVGGKKHKVKHAGKKRTKKAKRKVVARKRG